MTVTVWSMLFRLVIGYEWNLLSPRPSTSGARWITTQSVSWRASVPTEGTSQSIFQCKVQQQCGWIWHPKWGSRIGLIWFESGAYLCPEWYVKVCLGGGRWWQCVCAGCVCVCAVVSVVGASSVYFQGFYNPDCDVILVKIKFHAKACNNIHERPWHLL